MTILDVFYNVIKLDTSDLKKGTDDLDKSQQKITKSLKSSDYEIGKLGQSFHSLKGEITGYVAAAFSLGSLIVGVKNAFSYANDLRLASQQLGINIEELDAWSNAVRRTGGNAATFQQSVKSLASNLNISVGDTIKLLPMLADTFKKLSPQYAQAYGAAIGIDPSLVLLLQKGNNELQALIKHERELGTVTAEDAKVSEELTAEMQDLGIVFRKASLVILRELAPHIKGLLQEMTKFFQYVSEHKNLIVGALIGIGVAAAAAFWEFTLGVAAIAAVGAAFALAYEDVKAFFDGNESLIGSLLDKWPTVGKVIRAVFDGIKATFEFVLAAYEKLTEVIDKVKSYYPENIADVITGRVHFFKAEDETKKAAGFLGANSNKYDVFNQGSDKNINVTTGPINIETQATDAEGIGTAISRHLTDQMRQALNNITDGVVA